MGDKYLTEVINYERDIEPYRVIRINAGVGAGKNNWVKELITKEKKKILFITSRANTADIMTQDIQGQRWKMFEENEFDSFEEKLNVVATNAAIETYVRFQFKASDKATYLYNYFDLIVLDEAHSLVTDASFSYSPFYVKQLMKHLIMTREEHDCKIVFMTGTNEPIEELFSEELKNSKDFYYLDVFEECKHVEPEEVYLYPSQGIEKDIFLHIQGHDDNNSRILYFANSITRMESMVKELIRLGVSESEIGISYSEKKDRKFPPLVLENKDVIERELIDHESIPTQFKILITTSKNQEGISIKDEDVGIIITESNVLAAIKQQVGRVRHGNTSLIILHDAVQHRQSIDAEEIDIDKDFIKYVREYWNSWEFEEPQKQIDILEKKFPCIKYDYFRESFIFYSGKEKAFLQSEDNKHDIRYCVKYWNCGPYGEPCAGHDYFQSLFPYSEVGLIKTTPIHMQKDEVKTKLIKTLDEYGFINTIYDNKKKEELETVLSAFFSEMRLTYDINAMGISDNLKPLTILKKFGFENVQVKGHRKGTCFEIREVC